MGKVKIYDDCLVPHRPFTFKYTGADPWAMVNKITGMIKQHFHVTRGEWNQDDLKWDASGDPIWWYSTWWAAPEISKYSRIYVRLKARGNHGKTDNRGWFKLIMVTNLWTEFEGWGPLNKLFWYIYSFLFYNKVRRTYIEKCKGLTLEIKNILRDKYGLEVLAREPESW